MTTSLIGAVLLLIVVVLVSIRRLRWTPINARRLFRVPIVFLALGLISLLTPTTTTLDAATLLLIAAEVAVSIVLGAVLGALSEVRRSTTVLEDGTPAVESRTPWSGLILWVAVIIARTVIVHLITDPAAASVSAATSFLVFGANRLLFAMVLTRKEQVLDVVHTR